MNVERSWPTPAVPLPGEGKLNALTIHEVAWLLAISEVGRDVTQPPLTRH